MIETDQNHKILYDDLCQEQEYKTIAQLLLPKLSLGDVIVLHGDLGAGKTSFVRAIIQELHRNPDLEIPSPTYSLVQHYPHAKLPIDHYDLYRIPEQDNEEEILELGWQESLTHAVTFIEWPARLQQLLPREHICVHIIFPKGQEGLRHICIEDKRA